jgi:hypothetical protein
LPVVEDGDEGEGNDECHDRGGDHQVEWSPGVFVPGDSTPSRLFKDFLSELIGQVIHLKKGSFKLISI